MLGCPECRSLTGHFSYCNWEKRHPRVPRYRAVDRFVYDHVECRAIEAHPTPEAATRRASELDAEAK